MFKSIWYLAAGLQAVSALTPYDGLTHKQFPRYSFAKDVGQFGVKVTVVIREAPVEIAGEMLGKADFRIAVKTPILNDDGDQVVVSRNCELEEFLEVNDDGVIQLIFPSFDEPKSCTSFFIDAMNEALPGIIPDGSIALIFDAADRSLNVEITAPVKIPFVGFQ